jgi:uncharacterized protein
MSLRLNIGAFWRRNQTRMDGRQIKSKRGLSGLAALEEGARGRSQPPVKHRPPIYCGDIGLKIRADGVWLYQESPIRRDALVKLFAGVLRKEADGRTYLITPAEKVDVAVEDAAFLAVAMDVRGTGRGQQLAFTTNVGDVVACGPVHPLRFALQAPGSGLKPYVLVRGGLEALLARALVYDLADIAVEETRKGHKLMGVWSGGTFFPMQGALGGA